MKLSEYLYLIIVLLLLSISAGCVGTGTDNDQICTLIGCEDGVTVQISENRPDSLSLTIYLNDDSEAHTSTICTNPDSSCAIRTGGKTPETVTVEVEWGNELYRQTFTPEYEGFQPNGPNCPPTCRTALIEIDLSGN